MKPIAISLLVLSSLAPGQSLVAISYYGLVYAVSPQTGQAAVLGSVLPWIHHSCMAKDSQGVLYICSGGESGGTSPLSVLDPFAVTATPILTLQIAGIRALAFNAADQLFAIRNAQNFGPNELYQIDLTSGAATLVGATVDPNTSIPFGGIQGMTRGPTGNLFYAFDAGNTGFGLVTIDPLTGHTTAVNGGTSGAALLQTLAFDPSGALTGWGLQAHSVNPNTGVVTPLGPGTTLASAITGMEYLANGPSVGLSHHIGCWVAHTHWSVLGGTPGHAFYLAVAAANPNVQPGGWFLGIDLTFAELVAQLGVGAPFIGQLDAAGNAYTSLLVLGFACTGALSFDSVVLEFDAAGSFVQASAPLTQSL